MICLTPVKFCYKPIYNPYTTNIQPTYNPYTTHNWGKAFHPTLVTPHSPSWGIMRSGGRDSTGVYWCFWIWNVGAYHPSLKGIHHHKIGKTWVKQSHRWIHFGSRPSLWFWPSGSLSCWAWCFTLPRDQVGYEPQSKMEQGLAIYLAAQP